MSASTKLICLRRISPLVLYIIVSLYLLSVNSMHLHTSWQSLILVKYIVSPALIVGYLHRYLHILSLCFCFLCCWVNIPTTHFLLSYLLLRLFNFVTYNNSVINNCLSNIRTGMQINFVLTFGPIFYLPLIQIVR